MYYSSITQKTERHWVFVMVNVQTITSGHYVKYLCVLPPVITCVLLPRKSPPPKKKIEKYFLFVVVVNILLFICNGYKIVFI